MTDEIKHKKLRKPQFPEVIVAKSKRIKIERTTAVDFKNMTDEEWLERGDSIQKKLKEDAQKISLEKPRQIDHSPKEVAEMLFKLGVRSFITRNVQINNDKNGVVEAKAPDRPADTAFMLLDQFNDAALFDYVVLRAEGSPALKAMLSDKYAKLSAPEVEVDPIPTLALPEKAPRLWADRNKGTKAAQFLRETYAPWLDAGVLTRGSLKTCDKALYHAYHVWVHRHPEDAVTFRDAPPSNFIADPVEAIGRYREGAKNASARYRAKRATEPDPGAP